MERFRVVRYFILFFKHLKKVLVHKYWVAHYCFMCGLYWQGIVHDMSKFSPVEFFESVKFYRGTGSPINACRLINGYSKAWFHHRGRNKHHWVYWVDELSKGMIPVKMPYKYALEMICDFLGAGRAYMGKLFTAEREYEWWTNERAVLHEDTRYFVEDTLQRMMVDGIEPVLKDIFKNRYLFKIWYKSLVHWKKPFKEWQKWQKSSGL